MVHKGLEIFLTLRMISTTQLLYCIVRIKLMTEEFNAVVEDARLMLDEREAYARRKEVQ
jgi:hypothetical protein